MDERNEGTKQENTDATKKLKYMYKTLFSFCVCVCLHVCLRVSTIVCWFVNVKFL